jgi:hypothetical protein
MTVSEKTKKDILRGLTAGLADAIRAERDYPTRTSLERKLAIARQTRQIDEIDPLILSWLEPGLSERTARTSERIRSKASSAISKMRKGSGRDKYYPRPEGLSAATLCALIVSVLCNWDWPPTQTKDVQDLCARFWAAADGDVERRGGSKEREGKLVTDGFWRDHLREAKKWRDKPEARRLAAIFAGR